MFSTTRTAAITGLIILLITGGWIIFNSPPGVPFWGAVGKVLGVAVGCGAVVFALGALLLFRTDADRWLQSTRNAVLVCSILAVGLTYQASRQLLGSRQMSVDLLQDAPKLGHGATVLNCIIFTVPMT